MAAQLQTALPTQIVSRHCHYQEAPADAGVNAYELKEAEGD